MPFSSRNETRASPTASWVITSSTLKAGFGLFGGRPYSFLIFGSKCPQGVLHPVAKLTQYRVRNITPILQNASAIDCNVTVFPVPVAPATRPWRFIMPGLNSSPF